MTQIERALPQHATVLTDIAIAAKRYWKYPERWITIWIPSLTISSDYISRNETWMALVERQPVGFYSLTPDREAMWLDNLWVLPNFMRQSIGRQLFAHALERGRTFGITALQIEADPNAQNFYEKMGARKIGEHHGEVDGHPRTLPIMEIAL